MDNYQNSQPDGTPVLNVILHGAYAFARKSGNVEALIPALKHHVFRAGNWLGETELRGRGVSYELLGVTSGTDWFDPALNVFVNSHLPARVSAHTTLIFPIPKKIHSLRVAEVPRSAFEHREDLVGRNELEHVSTLQVFSYEFADENKLFLKASRGDGHYWEPVFTGNSINLHIFSAEDHFARLSNSEQDFNRCAKLLGSKVVLNTRLVPAGIPDPRALPPGVTEEETEDLATRTRRLARLGRLVTQKGDANLAWYGNDALDGNPEGCGGPIGH